MMFLFLIAGLAAGIFLPEFSEFLCAWKYRRSKKVLVPDKRYQALWLRIGCAVLNGGGWALMAWRTDRLLLLLLSSLIWFLSIALSLIDVRVHLVPNELLLIVAAAGIVQRFLLSGWEGLLSSALSMVALMAFFVLVARFFGGLWCVGAGDVKLAGALGLVLGYPAVLSGAMVTAAAMFLFCAVGLLTKKLSKTSMIPMAPFLSLGILAGLVRVFFF